MVVVTPPAANARDSIGKRSSAGASSPGGVCGSITPGSTWRPCASITRAAFGVERVAMSRTRPFEITNEPSTTPSGSTIRPSRTTRSAGGRRLLALAANQLELREAPDVAPVARFHHHLAALADDLPAHDRVGHPAFEAEAGVNRKPLRGGERIRVDDPFGVRVDNHQIGVRAGQQGSLHRIETERAGGGVGGKAGDVEDGQAAAVESLA